MANLVMDYYQGETEYSDGDIETELLKIVTENESGNFDDLLEKDRRWPIVYHLSHLRQNILNWYPFEPNAEILEVGAGCGALSGILCERGAHVTSVELTRRRAEINYQRNRNRTNLDIYVGDIFKMGFNRKFDYVTVIGVLEYAAFMSFARDPYSDFLGCVKKFLKPGGHILLAIENRFGLKYFAGAREDHTARFFDGVNDYGQNSRVRTFTKHELEGLLDKNALSSRRFYYPLPDYKFPSSIYTDSSVGGFDEWMNLGPFDNQRFDLFDEAGVMRSLAAEGALDKFANSFFVDIAADADMNESILASKLSAARNPLYRIATIIKQNDGVKTVEKVPLTEECKPHLRRMADNYEHLGRLSGIPLVPCRIEADGRAVFDFAKGEKYSTLISNALAEQGTDALWPLLDRYREKLFEGAKQSSDFYTDEFIAFFGTEHCAGEMLCVSPANIDLTLDNLMVDGCGQMTAGVMTAVDYEWVADFAVPCEYIFWRAIRYSDVFKSSETLTDEIYYHYGISKALCETFYNWEYAFSTKKIGSLSLAPQPNIKIDLNMVNPNEELGEITTGIAFDNGKGFDIENEVRRSFNEIGKLSSIKALIFDGVKSARFDPIEGFACQCHIVSAKCGDNEISVTPVNNVVSDDCNDYFLTLDPVYIVNGKLESGKILEISFIASKLDPSAADVAMTRSKVETQAKMTQLEQQGEQYKLAYDSVINSRSWKLTAPIRNCKKAIEGKN